MAKASKITEQLRAAIRDAEKRGMSRYQIGKAAGVALPVVIRIADGVNVPRLDIAEKIAHAIGKRLIIGD